MDMLTLKQKDGDRLEVAELHWMGDSLVTIDGFNYDGEPTGIWLNAEQVRQLIQWLQAWLVSGASGTV